MKTRKFLCLFVMALAVFALSGCGGGHDDSFVDGDTITTQSEDVTPTPTTSPDITQDVPTQTDSEDNTPSGDSEEADVTGESYTSSTALENALLVNGSTSTYTNITVIKTGDATGSSDGTSGYDWTGSNAAILAKGGANVTINGSSTTITSDAKG